MSNTFIRQQIDMDIFRDAIELLYAVMVHERQGDTVLREQTELDDMSSIASHDLHASLLYYSKPSKDIGGRGNTTTTEYSPSRYMQTHSSTIMRRPNRYATGLTSV